MQCGRIFLIFGFCCGVGTLGTDARAEGEFQLPEVEVLSSPFDSVLVDPLRPRFENQKVDTTGTGGIQRTLVHDLPIGISESGRPGANATVRGQGRSAEDTEVVTLGMSLNAAAGGGFDFASLPQFLWGGYTYQVGPSAGGVDMKASAGTLQLVPRTVQLLSKGREWDKWESGLGAAYSTADYWQLWAEVAKDERFAAVAGGGTGPGLTGGGFGVTGQWEPNPRWRGAYHFLGGYQYTPVPGSRSFPTPNATQRSLRILRVIESDVKIGAKFRWRSNLYFDMGRVLYSDPGVSSDRTTFGQGGLDHWLTYGLWRFSLLTRQSVFGQNGMTAPAELLAQGQIGRLIELGRTAVMEPSLKLVGVRGLGVHPGVALGVSEEALKGRIHLYQKVAFQPRFPSLMNRHYVSPFFMGNSSLRPEKIFSGQVGATWHMTHGIEGRLEILGQYRTDAMITTGVLSPFNSGWAASLGAYPGISWTLLRSGDIPVLVWKQNFGFMASRLGDTREAFPLSSPVISVTRLDWNWRQFQGLFSWRLVSGTLPSSGLRLPGSGVVDVGLGVRLAKAIDASIRIEDLFDRQPEWFPDFPSIGRVFSLALHATF